MRIEKNIYLEVNRYKVTVKIAKNKYTGSFTNLEDAKEFKAETLKLKKNKCNCCGKLTDKFNTSYCQDNACQKAKSNHIMTTPIKYPNNYFYQLSIDEAPRVSKEGNIECKCFQCKKYFTPIRSTILGRIGSLIGKSPGEKHIYCSTSCKSSCSIFGQKTHSKIELSTIDCKQKEARITQRSSKRDILAEQIKDQGYNFCERCGKKTEKLELHHSEGIADNYSNTDLTLNPNTHLLNCKTCHVLTHAACR